MSASQGPILIVARDQNGGIGFQGGLPWPRISEDMRHFRRTTENHIVIMGRKTFDSIGRRALPNRINIVVSRAGLHELPRQGIVATTELRHALAIASHAPEKKVFVIGGQQLYEAAQDIVQELLVTQLHGSYPADRFFPIWEDTWTLVHQQVVKAADAPTGEFTVQRWRRKDEAVALRGSQQGRKS